MITLKINVSTNQDYYLQTLVFVYEDFSSNIKMFDFSNYSTKSKYYNDSNK